MTPAAKAVLEIKRSSKDNKYQWNGEKEELIKEKNNLYLKWQNTKHDDLRKYNEKKRESRQEILK